MALRRYLGFSDGELMRADCKPCSRLMRQTAGIFTVGGGLAFWILCRLHYGPRITVPRALRWGACGAFSVSSSTALLVRLLSPEFTELEQKKGAKTWSLENVAVQNQRSTMVFIRVRKPFFRNNIDKVAFCVNVEKGSRKHWSPSDEEELGVSALAHGALSCRPSSN